MPRTEVFIADQLFGAKAYGTFFVSDSVAGVHKLIADFERDEWPQDRRVQSYVIQNCGDYDAM